MMRSQLWGILAAFIAVLIVTGIPTLHASAQEAASQPTAHFGIRPMGVSDSFFSLVLEPGESRDLEVELSNSGEVTGDALTFAADAYTIVNGGLGVKLAGESSQGTTTWIDYQTETVALSPGEPVTRSLRVTVPETATPGEYLAALVIQNADATGGGEGGVALKQVNRQAIAVAIDIPGERQPELAIGSIEHRMVSGRSNIRIGVENPGNVHLKLSGEFILTDSEGTEILKTPATMDTVYAGTSTQFSVSLSELLDAGEYTAALQLADERYDIQSESGLLHLDVPELVAPVTMQSPDAESGTASQPAIQTQTAGIPTWVILVAIPLAILAGAVVVYLAMKRKMQPQVAQVPASAAPMQRPPVVTVKRVPVRQIVPPTRQGENG